VFADDIFDFGQDFEPEGEVGITSRHDFVDKSASDEVLGVDRWFFFDDFFGGASEESRKKHRRKGERGKKGKRFGTDWGED